MCFRGNSRAAASQQHRQHSSAVMAQGSEQLQEMPSGQPRQGYSNNKPPDVSTSDSVSFLTTASSRDQQHNNDLPTTVSNASDSNLLPTSTASTSESPSMEETSVNRSSPELAPHRKSQGRGTSFGGHFNGVNKGLPGPQRPQR